ncbi:MAG TPA: PQQ-binding-like beta-propeller repeat protein [Caulobacterales bacterium]|nr:PQQ-binding-like beta-propeller repeat protein [Caulobacterales bacterium]
MTNFTRRDIGALGAASAIALQTGSLLLAGAARAQTTSGAKGEWRTYGGDLASRRYAPLDQINAANFKDLKVAWRFHADNLGPSPDPNLQATPLMVGGALYLTAGTRRAAVALDARTGEMRWKFNMDEGVRGAKAPRPGSGRGLAYWTDGSEERILFVTPGYQLVALNARTGQPIANFGKGGIVDLKADIGVPETADIGLHAAPLVVGDVVVVGAAHLPSMYLNDATGNIKGKVRGFDVRTGKRLWIFHPIPNKGEPGYNTWLDGSAERNGNAGSWAQMSADPELGLVYFGIELPTGDWYGGNRPGAGLFGESIVALDVQTGAMKWYYQTVHHGIWDMDIPCAAILADIVVGGRRIKALAQPTKHGFLFVLDRVTGKPVWPIHEKPVEKGNVPTEWYSPTQPFPSKPPAFDRQGMTEKDLIDFTPELRKKALALIADYKLGDSVFSPPCLSTWPRPLGTIISPTGDGSAQWPGGAFDPETNTFYIFSNLSYGAVGLVPGNPAMTRMAMTRGFAKAPGATGVAPLNRLTVDGLPLFKPWYGRITAIDLNRGETLWQVPHGETPDEVRNHPALKGMTIPPTGSIGKVGVLATKTLLIAGDGTTTTGADGVLGAWLRAYDKRTGAEVGKVRMDTRVTGSPMTYALDDKQYIAVPISGPGRPGSGSTGIPGELVAYRLP